MRNKRKPVYGVGINDADYAVTPKISGKQVICQFYRAWKHMLGRCYDPIYLANRPTYSGCSVDPEWHSFMAFRAWMSKQKWQGMDLDKDLLFKGNKVYGPNTCVFVSSRLNGFILDNAANRGEWPAGVYWNKRDRRFCSRCNNPFTGRSEHLGYFTCPAAAHKAWRLRKHEHALKLAAEQTDSRLACALSTRYLEGLYTAMQSSTKEN